MAKISQVIEANETPLPWKILERNQKLRDGREVVDVAGDTAKSPEWWEIVATKMLPPDARRMIAATQYCKGVPTELLEQLADGKPERSCHVFHEQGAEGVITLERGAHGLYVHINGKCLLMVDLFYFSPDWKGQDGSAPPQTARGQGSDFPQIVIYSGDDADDVFAHVRWRGAQVVIESDHPTAKSESEFGPGEVIQRLTIGENIDHQLPESISDDGGIAVPSAR